MQEWLDKHWKGSWAEDASDRWNAQNLENGWDLEEVRQEFGDFFQEHGHEIIEKDHLESDKFETELKQTLRLYNKGIASGKVTDEEYRDNDGARFQKLYDIALVSAR